VTYALVAAGACAAALAIVLAYLVGLRRAERSSAERVGRAVADLHARMEQTVGDLSQALERAEAQGRRERVLGEISATLDLDDVLTRTLEAASSLPGADAALVSLAEGANGKPLVATLGLSTEEAKREGIVAAGPPDGSAPRSIAIAYRYASELLEQNGDLIHGGVVIPLVADDEQHGHLAVFSRSPGHTFGEDAVRGLEEIGERAGPAIENARRFHEARQLADLDALTGLHNRRYFHETLAREVARASRYDRKLALLVLDLDDFKAINDRIGHLAGDAVLAEAAERILEVVRSADIACRVGGDEFAVILPESGLADAEQLYRRVLSAVSSRGIGPAGRLFLSGGVAELQRGDDAATFFQRADDALYRAKNSGKGRLEAAQ
jgi:two-component system, cell cycle response regulator